MVNPPTDSIKKSDRRPKRKLVASGLVLSLVVVFLAAPVWAGLSTTSIMEVQTGGSDSANGGGFDPANANMATDLAATVATSGAPVVTSASYNFVTRDNGAWLFIKSGTNWTPGWYKIASTSGNAATLTATVGTAPLYPGSAGYGYIPYQLNTVAGCATVASPTSGTWSIDYSQSASPGIVYTDMVIDGTTNTKYTSAGNPVGPNIVGNMIGVTSGTGFTVAHRQVSSVSGTTATCDASLGTLSSTGGHGGLGGAYLTPGNCSAQGVNLTRIFIKFGTYTFSTNTNFVAGGLLTCGTTGAIAGYNTTRIITNTDANRPTLVQGANSETVVSGFGGSAGWISNLKLDNTSAFTGGSAFVSSTSVSIYRCDAFNFKSAAFNQGAQARTIDCFADTCSGSFTAGSSSTYHGCVCKSPVGVGLQGSVSTAVDCISYGGTNNSAFTGLSTVNCVAYNWTGTGIGFSGTLAMHVNDIADSCTTGFSTGFGLINCAVRNNTADTDGATSAMAIGSLISLTASPFTAPGSGDFSLNTTAGGGALLRGLAIPTPSFPGGLTATTRDVGAAQHADPAGGGFRPRPRTSFNLLPEHRPTAPRIMPAPSETQWRKAG